MMSKAILALVGSLIVIAASHAVAQNSAAIPDDRVRGILHVLDVTIKSDPASPYLRQSADESPVATLAVLVRISAHSQETNFFGNVRAIVPDFDPIKGSREHEVWRDAKCHHERGFPKITLLYVDGSVTTWQKKHSIKARFRQIGLPVPSDEVMQSKRLDGGNDNLGPFIATRTDTKQSRLFVDLKLHILPCDLRTGALIAASAPMQKSMPVKKNASRLPM